MGFLEYYAFNDSWCASDGNKPGDNMLQFVQVEVCPGKKHMKEGHALTVLHAAG